MAFTPRYIGAANTLEHRVYIEHNGTPVSAWHDVPLFASQNQNVFNMIVAAPRWTDAAMQVSQEEPFNPLKQAVKRNKLRFVRSCFPHHGYIWNYGVFPQTWEDPAAEHAGTAAVGGNGPLVVCEIGEQVGYVGQIKQVKVLGVIAPLDEGAIDWKVIVVDVTDPLADKLNNIEDVDRELPGLIRATGEWLRIYKIPDGKPENKFALSGEAKNNKYATAVIREFHEAWRRLVRGESSPGNNSITNLTVERSPGRMRLGDKAHAAIPADSRKAPAPVDPSISKWFHLSAV